MIYFIQAGACGPIKIGVSQSPIERLPDLQSAHYEELHLLGVLPGDSRLEARLHMHFYRHRIRGEWFKPDKELLDFIAKEITAKKYKMDWEWMAQGIHVKKGGRGRTGNSLPLPADSSPLRVSQHKFDLPDVENAKCRRSAPESRIDNW